MSTIKYIELPQPGGSCCPACGNVLRKGFEVDRENFDPDERSETIAIAGRGAACEYELSDDNCTCGGRRAAVRAKHMRGAMEPWKGAYLRAPYGRGDVRKCLCGLEPRAAIAPWRLSVYGRGAYTVHVHELAAGALLWTPDREALKRQALALARRLHGPMRKLINQA